MEAVTAFSELDELPNDDLMREVVLADAELQTLMDHGSGATMRLLIRGRSTL